MLGSLVLLSALIAPGAYADTIDVDFAAQPYDRTLFRPKVRRSLGRWEMKDGKLRAEIPKGGGSRPPIGFVGLFRLEGDFEVTADFEIVAFPKPKPAPGKKAGDAMNSIELVFSGPPGWCVASRKSLAVGERASSYGELDGDRKFISDNVPVSGTGGRLEIRRVDKNVLFYHAQRGASPVLIGMVPFGDGPVDEVGLQVYAMNTVDALDVRFDRVRIGADRILRNPLGTSPRSRILIGVLCGLIAFTLGYAGWRYAAPRMIKAASSTHAHRGRVRPELVVAVALLGGITVAIPKVTRWLPSPGEASSSQAHRSLISLRLPDQGLGTAARH